MRCQMPGCKAPSDCRGCDEVWDDAHGWRVSNDAYFAHYCSDCRQVREDRTAHGLCPTCGTKPCSTCGDCLPNATPTDQCDHCNVCDGECGRDEAPAIHYQGRDVWPQMPRGL